MLLCKNKEVSTEGLDWLNGSKLFHLSFAYLNSLRVTTINKIKPKQKTQLSYYDNSIFSYPGTISTTPNAENIIHNERRLHAAIKALTFHFMEVLLFYCQNSANLDLPNQEICIQEICV